MGIMLKASPGILELSIRKRFSSLITALVSSTYLSPATLPCSPDTPCLAWPGCSHITWEVFRFRKENPKSHHS